MSEPIPESIPTSADPRSRRPIKKARGPATPGTIQSTAVEALFAKPDRDIHIPTSATRGPRSASSLAPPPEIVANVQGSSAGAGSGEFHVYKASRRREYERVRLMEDEADREEADAKWEQSQREKKERDEQKANKNAKKREKAKARKAGIRSGSDDGSGSGTGKNGINLAAGRPKDLDVADNNARENGANVVEEGGIIIHDED